MRRKITLFAWVLFISINLCFATTVGSPIIHMSQSHSSGLYRSGDRVVMKTFLEGTKIESITVKVMKGFDMNYHTHLYKNTGDTITVFDLI